MDCPSSNYSFGNFKLFLLYFLILWGDNAPFVEDSGLLAGLANIVIKIGIPVLAVVLSKTYIPFA